MAKKRGFFSRFRIVYRHSPLLLKCAVLAAIVVSIAALTVIRINIDQTNHRKDAARVEAARLEQENAHTQQLIDQKDTVEGSKNIASEYLGYAEKDSVNYQLVTNQD